MSDLTDIDIEIILDCLNEQGYEYKLSKEELKKILVKNNFKIIFEWPSISIMSAPFKFEGFMALKND